MLALPGGAYIYQGEELGLPEVYDIPKDRLTDPRYKLSGYKDTGRDGCRVPIPWTVSDKGSHGFSTNLELGRSDSWLPEPTWWGNYAAEKQESDANSTLNIYRRALAARKELSMLGDGAMKWIDASADVLAFSRTDEASGKSFVCYVNFGAPVAMPAGEIITSSSPVDGDILPSDTTVWLHI